MKQWQPSNITSWWRHQMEIFSALLALCAGNSPVTGEFPAQRPVTRSFHVFFDLRLNKRLSKHSWGWWFETPSRSLWLHCNVPMWLHGHHMHRIHVSIKIVAISPTNASCWIKVIVFLHDISVCYQESNPSPKPMMTKLPCAYMHHSTI